MAEWRRERCLSVREVAKLAGISPSVYYRIENGERKAPHPKTIRKIAAAFGIEPSQIVFPVGVR